MRAKHKATVQDVALAARVSVATVDRVLNRRQGVREQTVARVERALRELEYRPDFFTVTFSERRNYRFVFVVPEGRNSFMTLLADEVTVMSDKLRGEHCRIELRRVPPFDSAAIAETLEALAISHCDGVAVVAPDMPGVRQAIDGCCAKGIKVITLVSDLPQSSRSHFIGIDNITAGRIAGRLLGRFIHSDTGRIAFIAGSMTLRDHVERHLGCEQVIRTEFPHLAPLPVITGNDDAENTYAALQALLSAPYASEIRGIYNVGAGNTGLIRFLDDHPELQKAVVIVHEHSQHSRLALTRGLFDAILCQNPEQEAHMAIDVLRELAKGKHIDPRRYRIQPRIFFPDNLP